MLGKFVMGAGGAAGGIQPITYVNSYATRDTVSTATHTVDFPTGTQSGDIAIINISVDNTTPTPSSDPTGWTSIGATGTGSTPRNWVWAKILTPSDIATGSVSVDYNAATISQNYISVFRAGTVSGFTAKNISGNASAGNFSLTLSASGVTAPALGLGLLSGRPGQTPTMTWTTATARVNITDNSTYGWTGYAIYDEGGTPANHTVSTNDAGRQAMLVFYLELV